MNTRHAIQQPRNADSTWRTNVPEKPVAALQAEIQAWANRYWAGAYWPPLANLARLMEESGEVARAINQGYGPKRIKPDEIPAGLEEEMGDLLFVLLCLANSTGADLQAGFEDALEKYRARDEGEQ
jgi:NTP pyrophosphatase (non-canonical NTP hydrolase)